MIWFIPNKEGLRVIEDGPEVRIELDGYKCLSSLKAMYDHLMFPSWWSPKHCMTVFDYTGTFEGSWTFTQD